VVNQDVQTKHDQLRRTQAELPQRAADLGLIPAAGSEVINISRYAAEIVGHLVGEIGTRDVGNSEIGTSEIGTSDITTSEIGGETP
jgi:hypothetical protein